MTSKQSRAETIVSNLLALQQDKGGPIGLGSYVATIFREGDLEIRLHPGHRWSFAPSYRDGSRTDGARRLIPDSDWRTIEVTIQGRLMFVANLREGEVEIHFFRPGQWEKRFGADPGDDTVIQQPWEKPRSDDLDLPPERTGSAGDDFRNPTMRQSRSPANTQGVNGAYTVALSQRTVPGF